MAPDTTTNVAVKLLVNSPDRLGAGARKALTELVEGVSADSSGRLDIAVPDTAIRETRGDITGSWYYAVRVTARVAAREGSAGSRAFTGALDDVLRSREPDPSGLRVVSARPRGGTPATSAAAARRLHSSAGRPLHLASSR